MGGNGARALHIRLDQPLIVERAAIQRGDRRRIGAAAGGKAVGGLEIGEAVAAEPLAKRRLARPGRKPGLRKARPARAIGGEAALQPVIDGVDPLDRREVRRKRRGLGGGFEQGALRGGARSDGGIDIAHPVGRGRAMMGHGIIGIGPAQQKIGAGQPARVAALRPGDRGLKLRGCGGPKQPDQLRRLGPKRGAGHPDRPEGAIAIEGGDLRPDVDRLGRRSRLDRAGRRAGKGRKHHQGRKQGDSDAAPDEPRGEQQKIAIGADFASPFRPLGANGAAIQPARRRRLMLSRSRTAASLLLSNTATSGPSRE